jgi:hypothetical protein
LDPGASDPQETYLCQKATGPCFLFLLLASDVCLLLVLLASVSYRLLDFYWKIKTRVSLIVKHGVHLMYMMRHGSIGRLLTTDVPTIKIQVRRVRAFVHR